jgi:NADPH-dependent glutamate synthase beta subunit-like oxidoreductase
MEAARIAALRGHRVTLFERTGELGGAMLCCCTVPGKSKMRWHADWLRHQLRQLGVEVKLQAQPQAADLRQFDVVLLATGSRVSRPEVPGINLPFVVTFHDVLRCKNKECEYYPADKLPPAEGGENVLIWGDHFGAADTAERLGHAGRKVTIVTANRDFALWLEPCHRDVMFKRFRGGNGEGLKGKTYLHPVTIIPDSTVTEIRANGEVVLLDNQFNRSTVKADTLVLANVEPNDALYAELLEAGLKVVKLGDAQQVRNLRGAVTDGANAALVIEKNAVLNANLALISDLPTDVEAAAGKPRSAE